MREALFEKRYRPGDFLGTEKDLAGRHGVSRMAARDALRTLEALGIVEISRGAGGGARITRGNPALFAEALAVQLELADIEREEIMAAQTAIEGLAAELAAASATREEIARLHSLVEEAEGCSTTWMPLLARACISTSASPRHPATACCTTS